MTESDSIFGAELDRLKRLLTVGEEEPDDGPAERIDSPEKCALEDPRLSRALPVLSRSERPRTTLTNSDEDGILKRVFTIPKLGILIGISARISRI